MQQEKNAERTGMDWNLPYFGSQMTPCIIDSSVFGRYWHGVLIDGIVWITGSESWIVTANKNYYYAEKDVDGVWLFDAFDWQMLRCEEYEEDDIDLDLKLIVNGKCGFYNPMSHEITEPPQWDFICAWDGGEWNDIIAFASNGCVLNGQPVNGFVELFYNDDFPMGGEWWELKTLRGSGSITAIPVDYSDVARSVSERYYCNLCVNDQRGGGKTASVGPFFVVDKSIFYAAIPVEKAETDGDFRISPLSHDEIWQAHFLNAFKVDYNYYPCGHAVYKTSEERYIVYADSCLNGHDIRRVSAAFGLELNNCEIVFDENYQCHMCNENLYEMRQT